MAASPLVFLRGNEKSCEDLDPLPSPAEAIRARVRGWRCPSSFQVGEDTKAKLVQAQPGKAWERIRGVLLSLCPVLGRDGGLGRAVLVAQAGAAPVQPQLLPRGFPLPNRALLIRGGDAQGRPLAPAAQAGLGRHNGDRSHVWDVGKRRKHSHLRASS